MHQHNTPIVAVITPCFNSASFLADCMQSVRLSHTYGKFDIEHIIVNDASTDTTKEVLLTSNYPNVKTYHLDTNHGPSYARNFAIGKTEADYIFCLDGDDVLFQNSLFALYTTATKTNSDWVYGDMIRSDENLQYQIGNDYNGWDFQTPNEVLLSLFTNKHFFQHNCLFSKSLFEKVGGYTETIRMGEDFDLYTRMLLAGSMPQYQPGPLYIHRFHKHNTSKAYTAHPERNRKVIASMYETYKTRLTKLLTSGQIDQIEAFLK